MPDEPTGPLTDAEMAYLSDACIVPVNIRYLVERLIDEVKRYRELQEG